MPFCTVVFIVTPGFERICITDIAVWNSNCLECLTLIRPYCFCSTGSTWASPLVVIPVLSGNRIHPSNWASLGLSKLEKVEPLKMMFSLFLFFYSVLTWQTLAPAQHGGKSWQWMAGGKTIQGEAGLSPVTNSACGTVSWGCAWALDRTLCVVTSIVVAQTFVELHCELGKGLGLVLLWFCVLGFFVFSGFFCFGLVFWTCVGVYFFFF